MSDTNDKGLRPGAWCKASSSFESDAIRSAATHNGISSSSVAMNWVVVLAEDPIPVTDRRVKLAIVGIDYDYGGPPTPAPEFIARMYEEKEKREQAEINKKVKTGVFETPIGPPPIIRTDEQVKMDDHEKRIKALEEMTRTKGGISHWVVDPDGRMNAMHGTLTALKERVSKLEGPIDLRDCRLLTSYTTPVTHRAVGPGYEMRIDPNASPVGLPFEIALLYAKSGRSIRRYGWLNNMMFVVDGLRFVDEFTGLLSMEDLSATDWLVVPEPQTP